MITSTNVDHAIQNWRKSQTLKYFSCKLLIPEKIGGQKIFEIYIKKAVDVETSAS